MCGVKKDMQNKKVIAVVRITGGVLLTILFAVMAFKQNTFASLWAVGGLALIFFNFVPASKWFRSFGVKNTDRKVKRPPSDG